jgi:hypothetical protein
VIIPHVLDTAFVKVAGNGIIYWSGWQFELEFQVWNQWLQHRCRRLKFGAGGYKTGISGRTPFLCCFYSWFCVQLRIHKSQARKESNKRAALSLTCTCREPVKTPRLCYVLYLSESIYSIKEVDPERQYEIYGELWSRKKQQGTEEIDAKNLHWRVRSCVKITEKYLTIVFKHNFKKSMLLVIVLTPRSVTFKPLL